MRAAIFGGSGGIGKALAEALVADGRYSRIFAGSRNGDVPEGAQGFRFDLTDETSIAAAARSIGEEGDLDLVIVATGLLHRGDDIRPERGVRSLDADTMAEMFAINTIGPALIAKHTLPLLRRDGRAVMAMLSARVGSIADNGLGGWHSYRASKAALNMLVRNFAIETGRRNRESVIVALHPGTVDSALSEPFQGNLPEGQLTAPHDAAANLLSVIAGLRAEDSGGLFAYDGERIAY